ncbi:Uncharacterized protein Rs2_28876 [Raphanus sativus]|nr:Uncharacterized protein Rs2_28876 [Raphanus sativus]
MDLNGLNTTLKCQLQSERSFKKKFNWDASINYSVEREFNKTAAYRLKGMEANNEDSSFIAVMKKTHQRPDGTYVDERARLVAETYEKHVEERLGQLESSGQDNVTLENLDQSEKNEIYVKAAGMSKQGRVFGLGALHSKILPACDVSPNAPETSEEVEKITQRLQEVEAELKQSREENLQFQKRLENMETLVQSITNLRV